MSGVSLPSVSSARFGLIGNPENRRVREFRAAVQACGYQAPECVSYEALLRDESVLASGDFDLFRIESPGENETVAKGLIQLGGGPVNTELGFGEIAFLKEYHRGFCQILKRIEESGVRCVNPPTDIAVMFDKRECHRRFVRRGLARPFAELAPTNFNELWQQMRCTRNGRRFLKPLHGSSASGVCALRWAASHHQLIAPIKIASVGGRPALINSLKVCSYTSRADIELILSMLLPQGMISEQWIPKLNLRDGSIDLRVLVIAEEARHWVIRQSKHPMTNLHLGNRRGDENELRAAIGDERLEEAFRLAEQAAACFPDSLYAGVDILLDSRGRAFIGEINAFGDLLPGLTHRGESTYSAIASLCHDHHRFVRS